ncbi:MAG: methylenetetrahydrofolate--tRNA-(uracil(54)-C(5))-methyltransferase (FADH(2)-oxidizing) TrmFO [Oscillospiraceae bacterium]|nr:methylenetetrahydrofolate--tRNA-(uracil(54)-C(5))-methyltransferase (FADH(2)-oxidizing) TrmFO [Oscillospiraceae bacterium]
MNEINVIGAGLAGCEAAWQAAARGAKTRLFEMKPAKFSPAHTSENFAELVCSNSFKSESVENASGLLKKELEIGGSLIMEAAYSSKVPAGGALAVDREKFSSYVTQKIKSNENIEIMTGEITKLERDKINIIATGPLTSDGLQEEIKNIVGENCLYFFDAAAPIVDAKSIDFASAFCASRYGKGEKDYINCPMTKEEYETFRSALVSAETAKLRGFEKEEIENNLFEGCMPVEEAAKRGEATLLFGCMKPVGLIDARTGRQPYAVAQLRQDNSEGTMYNIVGFQTNLTFSEQKRVFSLIPALANCEILRYGVMHKNTYINSPRLLDCSYNLKKDKNIYFAGQITGTEGYICSASSGFVAGVAAAAKIADSNFSAFPRFTAIGALAHYISDESVGDFQPMGINFGIIESPKEKIKGGKKSIKQKTAEIALEYMKFWKNSQK